ncbi:c-type cytochrome [Ramlibacter sp.]|uniref:c-type cytochrome n=1 Tax=Ramlibacter sp. TaxID=1917967 RepID=UPI002FCADDAE
MRLLSSLLVAAAGLQAWPALGAATEDWAQVAQRAADGGCYKCHGEPPRRNVPTLREIAARYAAHRGRLDAATEKALADRLHHGSTFSHIAAHERLSEQDAASFIRWLVAGGPDAR